MIFRSRSSDSGTYTCEADNGYSSGKYFTTSAKIMQKNWNSPQLAWIIQHNTIFLLQVEIQFELLLRMFKSLSNVRTIPISQTANWLSELNIVQTSIMQNFAAGRVQWQVSYEVEEVEEDNLLLQLYSQHH